MDLRFSKPLQVQRRWTIAPIHCSHFIGPKGQPYVSPRQRLGGLSS